MEVISKVSAFWCLVRIIKRDPSMWLLLRLRRQMVSDFKQDGRPNHWHTHFVVEKVDYGYCGSIFHDSGDVYGMTETGLMKSVAQGARGRTSPTAPTHGVAHSMTQTPLHNRHKHGPQQKACLWSLDRFFPRITRVTHKLGSYMCSDLSENVIYTRSSRNHKISPHNGRFHIFFSPWELNRKL